MGKTPGIIHFLRALVMLLLAVMIAFGSVTYIIQNKSQKNIAEAARILREKDQPLELLDQCVQQVYKVDNYFRLYTLSFSKESFDNYSRQLKTMDSLTLALQARLSSRSGHTNSIYSIQNGTKEKEVMLGRLQKNKQEK